MKFPRLVAVGDIHGELKKFQEILKKEHLIDSHHRWIGNHSILVQMGDVIDRGPHSIEVLEFIRRLQKEAEEKGGKVVRLLGNHELLMLQGDFYFSNVEDPHRLSFEILEEVLKGKIQAAFYWQNRVYTHAGIRLGILEKLCEELSLVKKDLAKSGEKITDFLNIILKEKVKANNYEHYAFWVDFSRGGKDAVGGIFWAHYPDLEREWMNPIRQVIGHSPVMKKAKNGIRWTKDANKINIDAGLYGGFAGNQAWIVVEHNHIIAKNLWKGQIIEETVE